MRTTVLSLVLCLSLLGQTFQPRHATEATNASDSTAHLSIAPSGTGMIMSSGAWIAGGGTSGVTWTTGFAGGVPTETRKLDGRGPTLKEIRYSAAKLSEKDLAPAGYYKLAKAVGVEISPEEAQLIDAIYDADLHIYPFDKVDNYLYRQALKQGTNVRWVWKPTNTKGLKEVEGASWRTIPNAGFVYPKVYSQRLPKRVLEEMKVILDKDPEALFLVSDYEVIKPDPFLAVTTAKLLAADKLWIIDQWDEPTFDDGERFSARVQ